MVGVMAGATGPRVVVMIVQVVGVIGARTVGMAGRRVRVKVGASGEAAVLQPQNAQHEAEDYGHGPMHGGE